MKQALTFSEETKKFKFNFNGPSIPYPMSGIFSREENKGPSEVSNIENKILELSAPGFPGQSGGPIVDIDGGIWSIYLSVRRYEIVIEQGPGKKDLTEVYMTGCGSHSKTITDFLSECKIDFKLSND